MGWVWMSQQLSRDASAGGRRAALRNPPGCPGRCSACYLYCGWSWMGHERLLSTRQAALRRAVAAAQAVRREPCSALVVAVEAKALRLTLSGEGAARPQAEGGPGPALLAAGLQRIAAVARFSGASEGSRVAGRLAAVRLDLGEPSLDACVPAPTGLDLGTDPGTVEEESAPANDQRESPLAAALTAIMVAAASRSRRRRGPLQAGRRGADGGCGADGGRQGVDGGGAGVQRLEALAERLGGLLSRLSRAMPPQVDLHLAGLRATAALARPGAPAASQPAALQPGPPPPGAWLQMVLGPISLATRAGQAAAAAPAAATLPTPPPPPAGSLPLLRLAMELGPLALLAGAGAPPSAGSTSARGREAAGLQLSVPRLALALIAAAPATAPAAAHEPLAPPLGLGLAFELPRGALHLRPPLLLPPQAQPRPPPAGGVGSSTGGAAGPESFSLALSGVALSARADLTRPVPVPERPSSGSSKSLSRSLQLKSKASAKSGLGMPESASGSSLATPGDAKGEGAAAAVSGTQDPVPRLEGDAAGSAQGPHEAQAAEPLQPAAELGPQQADWASAAGASTSALEGAGVTDAPQPPHRFDSSADVSASGLTSGPAAAAGAAGVPSGPEADEDPASPFKTSPAHLSPAAPGAGASPSSSPDRSSRHRSPESAAAGLSDAPQSGSVAPSPLRPAAPPVGPGASTFASATAAAAAAAFGSGPATTAAPPAPAALAPLAASVWAEIVVQSVDLYGTRTASARPASEASGTGAAGAGAGGAGGRVQLLTLQTTAASASASLAAPAPGAAPASAAAASVQGKGAHAEAQASTDPAADVIVSLGRLELSLPPPQLLPLARLLAHAAGAAAAAKAAAAVARARAAAAAEAEAAAAEHPRGAASAAAEAALLSALSLPMASPGSQDWAGAATAAEGSGGERKARPRGGALAALVRSVTVKAPAGLQIRIPADVPLDPAFSVLQPDAAAVRTALELALGSLEIVAWPAGPGVAAVTKVTAKVIALAVLQDSPPGTATAAKTAPGPGVASTPAAASTAPAAAPASGPYTERREVLAVEEAKLLTRGAAPSASEPAAMAASAAHGPGATASPRAQEDGAGLTRLELVSPRARLDVDTALAVLAAAQAAAEAAAAARTERRAAASTRSGPSAPGRSGAAKRSKPRGGPLEVAVTDLDIGVSLGASDTLSLEAQTVRLSSGLGGCAAEKLAVRINGRSVLSGEVIIATAEPAPGTPQQQPEPLPASKRHRPSASDMSAVFAAAVHRPKHRRTISTTAAPVRQGPPAPAGPPRPSASVLQPWTSLLPPPAWAGSKQGPGGAADGAAAAQRAALLPGAEAARRAAARERFHLPPLGGQTPAPRPGGVTEPTPADASGTAAADSPVRLVSVRLSLYGITITVPYDEAIGRLIVGTEMWARAVRQVVGPRVAALKAAFKSRPGPQPEPQPQPQPQPAPTAAAAPSGSVGGAPLVELLITARRLAVVVEAAPMEAWLGLHGAPLRSAAAQRQLYRRILSVHGNSRHGRAKRDAWVAATALAASGSVAAASSTRTDPDALTLAAQSTATSSGLAPAAPGSPGSPASPASPRRTVTGRLLNSLLRRTISSSSSSGGSSGGGSSSTSSSESGSSDSDSEGSSSRSSSSSSESGEEGVAEKRGWSLRRRKKRSAKRGPKAAPELPPSAEPGARHGAEPALAATDEVAQAMKDVAAGYMAACRALRAAAHAAASGGPWAPGRAAAAGAGGGAAEPQAESGDGGEALVGRPGGALLHLLVAEAAGVVMLAAPKCQYGSRVAQAAIAALEAPGVVERLAFERSVGVWLDAAAADAQVCLGGCGAGPASSPALSVSSVALAGWLIKARQLAAPPRPGPATPWPVGRHHAAPVAPPLRFSRPNMKMYTDLRVVADGLCGSFSSAMEPVLAQLVRSLKARVVPPQPQLMRPNGRPAPPAPGAAPTSASGLSGLDALRYVCRGRIKLMLRGVRLALAAPPGPLALPLTAGQPRLSLALATASASLGPGGRTALALTGVEAVAWARAPGRGPGEPLLCVPLLAAPLLSLELTAAFTQASPTAYAFPRITQPPPPGALQDPVDVPGLMAASSFTLALELSLAPDVGARAGGALEGPPGAQGDAAAAAGGAAGAGGGAGVGARGVGDAAGALPRVWLGELQLHFIKAFIGGVARGVPQHLRGAWKRRSTAPFPLRPTLRPPSGPEPGPESGTGTGQGAAEAEATAPPGPPAAAAPGPPAAVRKTGLSRLDISLAADAVEVVHDAQDPSDPSDQLRLRLHQLRTSMGFAKAQPPAGAPAPSPGAGATGAPRPGTPPPAPAPASAPAPSPASAPAPGRTALASLSAEAYALQLAHPAAAQGQGQGQGEAQVLGPAPGGPLPGFGAGLIATCDCLLVRLSESPPLRPAAGPPPRRPVRMVVQDLQVLGTPECRDAIIAATAHLIRAFARAPAPPPPPQPPPRNSPHQAGTGRQSPSLPAPPSPPPAHASGAAAAGAAAAGSGPAAASAPLVEPRVPAAVAAAERAFVAQLRRQNEERRAEARRRHRSLATALSFPAPGTEAAAEGEAVAVAAGEGSESDEEDAAASKGLAEGSGARPGGAGGAGAGRGAADVGAGAGGVDVSFEVEFVRVQLCLLAEPAPGCSQQLILAADGASLRGERTGPGEGEGEGAARVLRFGADALQAYATRVEWGPRDVAVALRLGGRAPPSFSPLTDGLVGGAGSAAASRGPSTSSASAATASRGPSTTGASTAAASRGPSSTASTAGASASVLLAALLPGGVAPVVWLQSLNGTLAPYRGPLDTSPPLEQRLPEVLSGLPSPRLRVALILDPFHLSLTTTRPSAPQHPHQAHTHGQAQAQPRSMQAQTGSRSRQSDAGAAPGGGGGGGGMAGWTGAVGLAPGPSEGLRLDITVEDIRGRMEAWQFNLLMGVINDLAQPLPRVALLTRGSSPALSPAVEASPEVAAIAESLVAARQELSCLQYEVADLATDLALASARAPGPGPVHGSPSGAGGSALPGGVGSSAGPSEAQQGPVYTAGLFAAWDGSEPPSVLADKLLAPRLPGLSAAQEVHLLRRNAEMLHAWALDQVSGAREGLEASAGFLRRIRTEVAAALEAATAGRRRQSTAVAVKLRTFGWALLGREGTPFVQAELQTLVFHHRMERDYTGTTRVALHKAEMWQIGAPPAAAAAAAAGAGAAAAASVTSSVAAAAASVTSSAEAASRASTSAASWASSATASTVGGHGPGADAGPAQAAAAKGDTILSLWKPDSSESWDDDPLLRMYVVHGGVDASYVTYEHVEVYLHPLQLRLTYAIGRSLMDYFGLLSDEPGHGAPAGAGEAGAATDTWQSVEGSAGGRKKDKVGSKAAAAAPAPPPGSSASAGSPARSAAALGAAGSSHTRVPPPQSRLRLGPGHPAAAGVASGSVGGAGVAGPAAPPPARFGPAFRRRHKGEDRELLEVAGLLLPAAPEDKKAPAPAEQAGEKKKAEQAAVPAGTLAPYRGPLDTSPPLEQRLPEHPHQAHTHGQAQAQPRSMQAQTGSRSRQSDAGAAPGGGGGGGGMAGWTGAGGAADPRVQPRRCPPLWRPPPRVAAIAESLVAASGAGGSALPGGVGSSAGPSEAQQGPVYTAGLFAAWDGSEPPSVLADKLLAPRLPGLSAAQEVHLLRRNAEMLHAWALDQVSGAREGLEASAGFLRRIRTEVAACAGGGDRGAAAAVHGRGRLSCRTFGWALLGREGTPFVQAELQTLVFHHRMERDYTGTTRVALHKAEIVADRRPARSSSSSSSRSRSSSGSRVGDTILSLWKPDSSESWDDDPLLRMYVVHGGVDASYVTYEHVEVYLHPLQLRLTYAIGRSLMDYFGLLSDEPGHGAPAGAGEAGAATDTWQSVEGSAGGRKKDKGSKAAAAAPAPPPGSSASAGSPARSARSTGGGWWGRRPVAAPAGAAGPTAALASSAHDPELWGGSIPEGSSHTQRPAAPVPLAAGGRGTPAAAGVASGSVGGAGVAAAAPPPARFGPAFRRRHKGEDRELLEVAGLLLPAAPEDKKAPAPAEQAGEKKKAEQAAVPGGGSGEARRRQLRFRLVRFNRIAARLRYIGPRLSLGGGNSGGWGVVVDAAVYKGIEGGWRDIITKYKWDVIRSVLKSAAGIQAGKLKELRGLSAGGVGAGSAGGGADMAGSTEALLAAAEAAGLSLDDLGAAFSTHGQGQALAAAAGDSEAGGAGVRAAAFVGGGVRRAAAFVQAGFRQAAAGRPPGASQASTTTAPSSEASAADMAALQLGMEMAGLEVSPLSLQAAGPEGETEGFASVASFARQPSARETDRLLKAAAAARARAVRLRALLGAVPAVEGAGVGGGGVPPSEPGPR
ncbi:hypothetical protein HYH03_018930 [Edaphochlamys debaryana]|uniref:Uncharacterized protein n=1 Tax=Edaphochlamys debaryana TaxID=47281 RepID=A0A835XG24_9CHLO|nr:hypothetical protein HYH03_018930 [Edaphochlamys debaryana]|eukprot:KAG2482123.1 hypothetical protein HYH03_018930 [Edaphochlamys debaryana]